MANSELRTILIVDDTPSNINLLGGALQAKYKIKVATSGAEALKKTSLYKPDLILLDVMMPGMNGYETCRLLKENKATRAIPVIFVTALSDIGNETQGFEAGAVDYITKPVSIPIVRARVKTHLALFDQERMLSRQVKERTEELSLTQDVTISSLATLAEYRDNETGGHIKRTQHYVRIIAEYLLQQPNSTICRDFDQDTIDTLVKSAPLHDIGKIGIPDSILLKPGKLTREEFEEMKRHTIYGEKAFLKAEEEMGEHRKSSFLRFAREIAASHHEKWDGSGYPKGLAGEDIPVAGRLMTVADVYDSLVSKRVYKPPFSHKKAVHIMTKGDGRVEPCHFDPDVLNAFLATQGTFREIAIELADSIEERNILEEG